LSGGQILFLAASICLPPGSGLQGCGPRRGWC